MRLNKQYNLHICNILLQTISGVPKTFQYTILNKIYDQMQNIILGAKYKMYYYRRSVESCKHSNLCARKSSGNQVRKKDDDHDYYDHRGH